MQKSIETPDIVEINIKYIGIYMSVKHVFRIILKPSAERHDYKKQFVDTLFPSCRFEISQLRLYGKFLNIIMYRKTK